MVFSPYKNLDRPNIKSNLRTCKSGWISKRVRRFSSRTHENRRNIVNVETIDPFLKQIWNSALNTSSDTNNFDDSDNCFSVLAKKQNYKFDRQVQ